MYTLTDLDNSTTCTLRMRATNAEADDREMVFAASQDPGTYEVTALLADPNECQPAIGDETVQDALKRCSAKIPVNVRRPSSTESAPESPVNPSGTIRELITDSEGTEYAVFTPE